MRVYDYSTIHQSKLVKKVKAYFRKVDKKKLVTWLFRLTAAGILFIAFLFIYFSFSLPNPSRLLGRDVPQSTKIYDRNGGLLYEVHGEFKRTLVNLDQIPEHMQQATIAIEDKNFYKHSGISVTGIIRSVIVDITSGSKAQGGSTITQQFVKNAVLTREKSLWRKIKEIILSIEIEARFSKADILKLYLNEIPYGRNAYGIQAAAQTYFDKEAKDLTLAESAYLAALPQAPTFYSPTGPNFDRLQARQHAVLQAMKDQGYITEEEQQQALNEKVNFVQATNSITAPYFVMYVQDYLAQKYGELTLEQGGLKVYTTLDPDLQTTAEEAIKSGVEKFATRYNANNAALVAVDPKTGQILAMVGGKDYFGQPSPAGCKPGRNCLFEPNVNVATSQRQPGSSFKPYVYVTAFGPDFKYSPASLLVDVTTNFGSFGGKDYIPHNYNGQSYGPLSMRRALAGSLNVPAVKTLALVGVDNATETAHDLGITSPLQNCGLSLVLGGCEVKLVDHTAAFAAIANMGDKHEKTAILKIEGEAGEILEEYEEESQQVLDPQAAYELINVMSDNSSRSFIFGGNSPLNYSRPVGCKTGTTQNWHDGWTLCFTPSIAIGVWAGNNDGTLLRPGADGVLVAAPIVRQVMDSYLKDKPVEQFNRPEGITEITVDTMSGQLPTQYSPSTRTEVFADYAVPTQRDQIHVPREGGQGLPFPGDNQLGPVCLNLHSEMPNNPNWENPVKAWAATNGGCNTGGSQQENPNAPRISITSPTDGAVLESGPVRVSANVTGPVDIDEVELIVDDETAGSRTRTPYEFNLRDLADGPHTLTIRATDEAGASSVASVRITIGEGGSALQLIDPRDGESLALPAQLTAESDTDYDQVTFYYQQGSSTKAIGSTDSTGSESGIYQYNVVWSNVPAGSYELFVRSNTGASSPRITVTTQ